MSSSIVLSATAGSMRWKYSLAKNARRSSSGPRSKALSALIWVPLQGKVGDAKKIILSPDAALWLVPWGALPVGAALAGLVGHVWGVREAIAASGVVALVVALGTGVPLLRLPSSAYAPEQEPHCATNS